MRRLVHAIFVLLLPIIVAAFGLSVWTALALVVLALLWYWLLRIASIMYPEKRPPVVLETIPISHFAEKVRWCMDRLGVDYVEEPWAGILGVLFTGRTVPRLSFRSGIVRSSIGNSAEILRYLWGHHSDDEGGRAAFLEPTTERRKLEKAIDRYGLHLQAWVYYHLLSDRELTLRFWGIRDPNIPRWQRVLMRPLFPLTSAYLKYALALTDEHYAKAVEKIEDLLGDVDTRLADGRTSILGGSETDYVDITFAAISGLWLQPENYGGGKAGGSRVASIKFPGSMRADTDRWTEDYPRATALILRLYEQERLP
jgi:glutathione S-transferase